jgi:hypothetical protein
MSLISRKKRKKIKTNPNEIKYRQKSKTCTIKKKSPQYKSAQTYSERLLNMTKLENNRLFLSTWT